MQAFVLLGWLAFYDVVSRHVGCDGELRKRVNYG
jgi:hypothetical protein